MNFMKPYEKRAICDCAVQSRIALKATYVLLRLLGPVLFARLAVAITLAKLQGQPWKGMSPVTNQKEHFSRVQIGDAILLYRALLPRMTQEAALEIMRKIVAVGAGYSFAYLIEPISPDALSKTAPEKRRELVERNLNRFPNSDCIVDEAGEECVAFRVVRCRFAELSTAAGHPELAPAFCSADKDFFEEHIGLAFARPHTIAEGATSCPFRLCRRPQGGMN
jgi:hypothetical protein